MFCLARMALFLVIYGFSLIGQSKDLPSKIKFPAEKYQLENGMTVILHEDHSAPILSYHQWYRVGSRHEKVGRTGLAHFFEHLMFKGTKKYPMEKLERVIQRNGGTNNAFTSRDYTGYYANMPSGKVDLMADIESDRMVNLIFDEKKIKSEREVVKEERRMRVENSVFGSLFEALFRTVYKVNNYRWPVIGYMKDLNAATLQDLKEFYRIYYAPNNSVLVIAGDFDSKKVKKIIKKRYGDIPRQEIPEEINSEEPVQSGVRRTRLKKAVQSSSFAVSFLGPRAGDQEGYALDLLSNILSKGTSSRLYKRLVYREQVASGVSSWLYSMKNPGVFSFTVSLKPGKSVNKAMKSINGELYRVRTHLVSKSEMEKAKNQILKSYVDSLKTVSGRARAFALNEVYFNNYSEVFDEIGKYNKVTAEDLMKVANKYLKPNKRSIIEVIPKANNSSGV